MWINLINYLPGTCTIVGGTKRTITFGLFIGLPYIIICLCYSQIIHTLSTSRKNVRKGVSAQESEAVTLKEGDSKTYQLTLDIPRKVIYCSREFLPGLGKIDNISSYNYIIQVTNPSVPNWGRF